MRVETGREQRRGSQPRAIEPSATDWIDGYGAVLCMTDYDGSKPLQQLVRGYRGVRLGDVDVVRYEGVGHHLGHRKAQHIEVDRIEDYLVSIPLHAQVGFSQNGYDMTIQPGLFVMLSTAKPFTASLASLNQGEVFSGLNVRIAGKVLRERMPHVDQCCGVPIRVRPGAGVILQRMCELALEEGRSLSPNETRQFASMLVDALINAASEAPEVMTLPEMGSRGTYLRIARQAKAFINMNLSDPDLDTDAVAAHCGVSKRYLQAVFSYWGEPVRATIRNLRLDRCRDALRNPALRHQSVAQIAMHWGFNDLPHFCRSYKARFDQSPNKERDGE